MTKVTIRNLRHEFPKVKEAVEAEGEVIITESGVARYKPVLYTSAATAKKDRTKDYMARMRGDQERAVTPSAAKALHGENRGER
jgi:antitoxin (DNA-binding transcriptional repressor) of toxin-antitoxin stability system